MELNKSKLPLYLWELVISAHRTVIILKNKIMRNKIYILFLLLHSAMLISANVRNYSTPYSGIHITLSFADSFTCYLSIHYDYPVPGLQHQIDTLRYTKKGNTIILRNLSKKNKKATTIPFPESYYSALDYVPALSYSFEDYNIPRNRNNIPYVICRKSMADTYARYINIGPTLHAEILSSELLLLRIDQSLKFLLLSDAKDDMFFYNSRHTNERLRKRNIDVDSLSSSLREGTEIKKDKLSKDELIKKVFAYSWNRYVKIKEVLSFVDTMQFVYTQSIDSNIIFTIKGFYDISGSNVILRREETVPVTYYCDESNLQVQDSIYGFYILNNIISDTLLYSNGLLAYSKVYNRNLQPDLRLNPIECIDCYNRSIDRPVIHEIKIFAASPYLKNADQNIKTAFDRYYIPVNYYINKTFISVH